LIELTDVRFGYAGGAALFRGLSLDVRRGDRLGIVGANGSGKTTLFHLVMGLLEPSAGALTVLGRPVRSDDDHAFVRRRVGFLFQHSDDQLFCPTVEDDIAFGPLNLGFGEDAARAAVGRTLEELELSGYARRLTHRLSGGEKRLVALATALVTRPEVLLLDEPANGLDPRSRRRLISVLARLPATQVMSSHDIEFVRAACTRVVVLAEGALIADGATDDVLRDSDLLLRAGLEAPYSLESHREAPAHDHHHGAGPSHGHGHDDAHAARQHRPADA